MATDATVGRARRDESDGRMKADCGKLIGHLAVPHPSGSRTLLAINCNREAGHDFVHTFTDPVSGMLTYPRNEPTLTVDERGCVMTP